MPYAELHCRSAFSLLDGASLPEALAARAHRLGLAALALTDRDDLGGAVRFAEACRDLGLPGILGAEVGVQVPDPRVPRDLFGQPVTATPPTVIAPLVLLAETRTGYGNLSRLITRARLDAPRGHPQVSLETLAAHAEGLFALTGGPAGWVPRLLRVGDADAACAAAAELKDIFDGRLAIECWDHGLPEERRLTEGLRAIARALSLPWVVTNDVRYAEPPGRLVHDTLAALRHRLPLDQMGTRLRPNGEWYLKGAAQLARRWRHAPEGLAATLAIAERCAFRLADLRPALPVFPLPPGVGDDEYLARLVEQGAWERWGDGAAPGADRARAAEAVRGLDWLPEPNRRQLAHELALIGRLGMAGFFLIVWDIVRFARREGILVQGRGSAANSAVCYCLGITAVDPVKLGLLFERFLSEERREPPDIDLDIAHRERERVLQYVYQRYGREHAAMVCEQITWRGRSAVRDAAFVLGLSLEQGEALAAYSDRFSAKATADALRGTGEAQPFAPQRDDSCAGARVSDRRPVPTLGEATPAEQPPTEATRAQETRAEEPAHLRRDRAKRELARSMAETLGGQMAQGTQATTRARAVKEAARVAALRGEAPAVPTGGSTRPPTPAWQVHGSGNAQSSGSTRDFGASPLLAQVGLDAADPRVARLADVVSGLHQLPRHRSIHVGGFVLTREPLATVVPIEPASMPDRTVIQWEKDDLDPVGLVKIDLLGLGMLTLLQDCFQYVHRTRGAALDLARLDYADSAVYDRLCAADTVGVFQVESRAQQNTLPRMKPRTFYDLVVEVALIRPGPIQGDMVHPYLRRRAGQEPVTYPHPSLEPILKRTLGVPLFQEQGMQVAIAAAGFTPGEADVLRKAMGHKRSHEKMAAICQRMVDGMARNGIPPDVAKRIYDQINAFADYGFPESHAASFAGLVYASAYLKHYYAPEFTAALLNAQPMGFYSPGTIIEDARRHGVVVRPVCLRHSQWESTLERMDAVGVEARAGRRTRGAGGTVPREGGAPAPALRLGLRTISGLGSAAREALQGAVAAGPFTSLREVVQRTRLDRGALRALCDAGAFDAFVDDVPVAERRRTALWRVLAEARGPAGPLAPVRAAAEPAPLPPMTPWELTEADYRMTSLSLNGHPMVHLRTAMQRAGVTTAAGLLRARDGDPVVVAGLVICRQRPQTAKGFVFLTLEDETGLVNVVVMPKVFERQALLISRTPLLLVRGVVQVEQGVINVRMREVEGVQAPVGAEHVKPRQYR